MSLARVKINIETFTHTLGIDISAVRMAFIPRFDEIYRLYNEIMIVFLKILA